MENDRKVKLQAIVFSANDYVPIQRWSEKNFRRFEVIMPPGMARTNFNNVIFCDEIWNGVSDGILISDHERYSERDVNIVARILADIRKKIYSVKNGIEALGCRNFSSKQRARGLEMHYANSAILKVLCDCSPALKWLSRVGQTSVIPMQHRENIKCLERLGIVFRRNKSTLGMRRQRLKQVLARESRKLSFPYRIEDLIS